MEYYLRLMEKEDIPEIVKGEMKAFGHSLGEDFLLQLLEINPYSSFVVLIIDEKISGYLGLLINDNIEIMNIYVDPDYQGMGFGNMLMDFIIDVCEKSKAKALSLEVRPSNIRALNLYKKYGLKEVAIRKQYYDNGEDAILMVREFEVEE